MYKNEKFLREHYINQGKSMGLIGKELGIKRKTIEYWLYKYSIRKMSPDGTYYPIKEEVITQNDIRLQYVIGLTLADGHISSRSTCSHYWIMYLIDKDILESICTLLGLPVTRVILKKSTIGTSNNVYSLFISNKVFIDYITKYVPIGAKTFTVSFPLEYNRKKFLLLFRGFIDGDGVVESKSFNNNRLRVGIASKKLKDSLLIMMRYHYPDIAVHEYTKILKSGKEFYSLEANVPIDLLIELYNDYPEMSIKRKRNVVQKRVDDIVRTYGIINRKNW